MDNLAENVKSVPVWVWLLLGVVVFIAFTSHSASQTGSTVTVDDSAAIAADSQLQQTDIAARTSLGLRILDIAGALDLANIDAATHRHDTDAALEAVKIQNQPPPPQSINVTVTGTGSGSGQQPSPSTPTTPTLPPGVPNDWRKIRYIDPVTGQPYSTAQSNAALSDFTRDAAIAANNVRRTVRGVYDGAAGSFGGISLGPSVY